MQQWILGCLCLIFMSGCSELPNNRNITRVCFKGSCVKVQTVWSDEDVQKGLQHVKELPDDEGMLFVFEEEKFHRFWMKDTLIPLDIIWIDSYRAVVNMVIFVPPCVEDPCPVYQPPDKAISVLELKAGKVEQMEIQLGDRLIFKK